MSSQSFPQSTSALPKAPRSVPTFHFSIVDSNNRLVFNYSLKESDLFMLIFDHLRVSLPKKRLKLRNGDFILKPDDSPNSLGLLSDNFNGIIEVIDIEDDHSIIKLEDPTKTRQSVYVKCSDKIDYRALREVYADVFKVSAMRVVFDNVDDQRRIRELRDNSQRVIQVRILDLMPSNQQVPVLVQPILESGSRLFNETMKEIEEVRQKYFKPAPVEIVEIEDTSDDSDDSDSETEDKKDHEETEKKHQKEVTLKKPVKASLTSSPKKSTPGKKRTNVSPRKQSPKKRLVEQNVVYIEVEDSEEENDGLQNLSEDEDSSGEDSDEEFVFDLSSIGSDDDVKAVEEGEDLTSSQLEQHPGEEQSPVLKSDPSYNPNGFVCGCILNKETGLRCDRTYTRHQQLRKHRESAHDDQRTYYYRCKYCDEVRFDEKNKFKTHPAFKTHLGGVHDITYKKAREWEDARVYAGKYRYT